MVKTKAPIYTHTHACKHVCLSISRSVKSELKATRTCQNITAYSNMNWTSSNNKKCICERIFPHVCRKMCIHSYIVHLLSAVIYMLSSPRREWIAYRQRNTNTQKTRERHKIERLVCVSAYCIHCIILFAVPMLARVN